MDAVASFSSVIENVPVWTDQIQQLCLYNAQKHEEFRAEYTRIVSQVKPRRIKSPSVSSIRTLDNSEHQGMDVDLSQVSQPPDPAEISPFEAGNRYIYAQANRKRKPGTSFRSGASGPIKFRSKQMVVIHYDSHIQEQLDLLVKSIGAIRNNLRKGKMAYSVSKGLQLPTIGRKPDGSSASSMEPARSASASRSLSKPRSEKGDINPVEIRPTGEAAFQRVDKDLETCQNLCETAAHQFLRDGDCKIELDAAAQNLSHTLELAQLTLVTLKTEEKREEIQKGNASVAGSTHTESDTTLAEKSSREILSTSHKLGPSPELGPEMKRPLLPTLNSAPPMTTEIEVDDDSDTSSVEIDLGQYRLTNRSGGRTGLRA